MRTLGWTAVAFAGAAALLLAIGWFAFFGTSFGAVSSIDSNSMSHADEPMAGVFDPGEWRRAVPVDDREEVVTFYEGQQTGHRVGEDAGDVIVYRPVGEDAPSRVPGFPGEPGQEGTLVEHRAIAWVVYNESADAYDVPELGIHGQRELVLPGVGTYDRQEEAYVHRNLTVVLDPDAAGRHDGFLTKGDHNQGADQDARGGLQGIGQLQLVTVDRIEGKVVGHVDTHWITAMQIGVPIVSLAVAGGVYAVRRGHLDAVLPDTGSQTESCQACGTHLESDVDFCPSCGATRDDDADPEPG